MGGTRWYRNAIHSPLYCPESSRGSILDSTSSSSSVVESIDMIEQPAAAAAADCPIGIPLGTDLFLIYFQLLMT